MTRPEKRQVITLTVGGAAAVFTAVAGLFVADVPAPLKPLISSPTAWAIGLTCTLPLLILLAANQISTLLKTSTDREEIVQDVVKFLPSASTIVHFESSASAMEYLIENVPRAKTIWNTRMSRLKVEESDPENIRVISHFDSVVWKAVQNGTHYNWIISSEYEAVAIDLCARRKQYASNHRSTGICCYWILPESDVPFFHFVVLEYPDHRELLLGWALASSQSFAERVFLIRDERLVQYFRGLFDTYASAAKIGDLSTS